VSLLRVFDKYALGNIETVWLDSARVARRAWKDCAWSGYGLANICKKIGYNFKHHDALEDAKASGQIILSAIEKSGLGINDWFKRVNQPIDPTNSSCGSAVKREGNPEGELYGEVIVFTGALEIPRKEAATLAASVGCSVAPGVTKKTTILVVGDQDISKLAGKKKSSKHLKVEKLISNGQQIRIIKESDFKKLVNYSYPHSLPKKTVTSLNNGQKVDFPDNDLTKSRVYEGMHPASFSFSINLPDDNGWEESYQEARTFKTFPRDTSETFIKKMNKDLEELTVSLKNFEKEAQVEEDELLEDSVSGLLGPTDELLESAKDFLRGRLSWKDLALTMEEIYDEIDLLFEDEIDECHKKVWPLRKETYKIISDTMELIDSGNRDEAEEVATRTTTAPAAEQGDIEAQVELGYSYIVGRGVPQNDIQAYKWYSIAAAQGRKPHFLFDILKERMSASQIAEAKRLSKEWLEKNK
jgi:hypothetical protein